MSLRYLTKKTALNAATKIPVITNLNHMKSFPRAWLIRRTKHDPKLKSVRPADRIKWWNIVPGDTICLRGDKERLLHEVLSVNRLSNRVFLKNTSVVAKPGMPPPPSKNYHYSRCQLYIGEVGEFNRPQWDDFEPTTRLFATRLGISKPRWDRFRHCYSWRRYATAIYPKVALPGKLRIPWPERVNRTYPKPAAYDTTLENVQKITYEMPLFHYRPRATVLRPASESAYLDHCYNGAGYDPTQPFEAYLKLDLANPHSRAKKLERWKVRQAAKEARRQEILQEQLKDRDGRTERQIRADAAYLWRREMEAEAKAQKKARWMNTARAQNWERKAIKKKTKEQRKRRRLTELTLEEEANQVIPKALKGTVPQ